VTYYENEIYYVTEEQLIGRGERKYGLAGPRKKIYGLV